MTEETLDVRQYHGLAKNSLWVMISNISMVFVLILTVMASRVLGDTVFGQYTFLLAVATLLAELSVIGTTDYVSIISAREPGRTGELVGNSLGLRIPLSLLFIGIVTAIAWFSMPEALLAAILIGLDWIVRTIIHLLRGVMRAHNQFRWDTQATTIERVAVLVFAGMSLLFVPSLVGFAIGFLVGRLVGLVACLVAYYRLGERIRVAFDRVVMLEVLRGGYPIGIRSLLKGISFRIDATLLGLLRPAFEVGWYGAAYKFIEAGFFFTETVGLSFQPAISRAFGEKKTTLVRDLYGRGYKVLLIVGGFAVAAGFLLAEPLVQLIFGSEYTNAIPALQVLVWALPLVFAYTNSIMFMDAVGSQKRTVAMFAASVVLNLGMNLVLIPRIGYMGAAWSTLATEAFLAVGLLVISFRSGYAFPFNWLVGPVLASIAFVLVGIILWSIPVVALVTGSFVFVIVLGITRVFDQTDFRFAQSIFKRFIHRGPVTEGDRP